MSGMTPDERRAAAERYRRTGQRCGISSHRSREDSPESYGLRAIISTGKALPAVTISRAEIAAAKKSLKENRELYGEVVRIVSHPAGTMRVAAVKGTPLLLHLLQACILIAKIIVFVAIALWLFVGWKAALVLVLAYFMVINPFHTHLNYEIAARLVVLDRRTEETE